MIKIAEARTNPVDLVDIIMEEFTTVKVIGSAAISLLQVWYISLLYKETTFMPYSSEMISGNSSSLLGFMLVFRKLYEILSPFFLASINLLTAKGILTILAGEEVLFFLASPKDPNLFIHTARLVLMLIIHAIVTFINFKICSRKPSTIEGVLNAEMYHESAKSLEKLKRISHLSDAYETATNKNEKNPEIVKLLKEKQHSDIENILFFTAKKAASW